MPRLCNKEGNSDRNSLISTMTLAFALLVDNAPPAFLVLRLDKLWSEAVKKRENHHYQFIKRALCTKEK